MIGCVVDGYTIKKKIGEGGMATVYYAENNIGKAAAIKVLNDECSKDPDIRKRFRQEADIMLSLKNIPGICGVEDFAELPDGKLALVMEYLEGMNLKEWVTKKGKIADDIIRKICNQVLPSLGEAHKRGIIHRDIKPSNLFRTSDGRIIIMDFGISKMLYGNSEEATEKETTTRRQMGTLSYMSPEQIKCTAAVDQRADIYSFGLTLYFLLTGNDPLDMDDDSLTEIKDVCLMKAIRHATRKSLDKRTADYEQFLNEILQTEKQPEEIPEKKAEVKPGIIEQPVSVLDKYPQIDFIPASQFKVMDVNPVATFFMLIPIFMPFTFITMLFFTSFRCMSFRQNAQFIENPHRSKRVYHRIVKNGKFGIFRWEGWKTWPKEGLLRVICPKVVIKPQYDFIQPFDGIKFVATKDNKTYYLDEKGNILK